jgi:CubicO group peptidase (beta-lactamase class C family)
MTRFAEAKDILQRAIETRVFPGAVFGVWRREEFSIHAAGKLGYEPEWPAVTTDTIYDIASLTKVMATTAVAMQLWQAGKLDLATPVCELLPQFTGNDPRRAQITLEMLLAHTSGLPAYAKFYEVPAVARAADAAIRRAAVVEACCTTPLTANPGQHAEYSDIGFILLGEALCALSECADLNVLYTKTVYAPLGLSIATYLPSPELHASIAPTCDWNWRHRVLQGEVQDENCAAMGGVAGHAGLFSHCRDLLQFAAAMLTPGGFFSRETIHRFSQPVSGPRALGWDTPSQPSQSGQYFSPRSIGHLGYAGTSLWIDLDRATAVALLTNRVYTGKLAPPMQHPDAISQVRPRFHDSVMQELFPL